MWWIHRWPKDSPHKGPVCGKCFHVIMLHHITQNIQCLFHCILFLVVGYRKILPIPSRLLYSWWRHQMETFSALLAICAGNSPVTGEFPAQKPVTRSFDVFFDLRLNERLSKQSWGWWFETPSCPLWRHSNVLLGQLYDCLSVSELIWIHVMSWTYWWIIIQPRQNKRQQWEQL